MRRSTFGWAIAGLLLFAGLAGCAVPQESQAPEDQGEHVLATPRDLDWGEGPASLPPGARMAVLSGDPTTEGPFTLRFEFPAEYKIPPHTHPRVERVTVLSGDGHVGMGPDADLANATYLGAGSYFEMPIGTVHWFVAGAHPVVVQLNGVGPWSIDYADPADDPRG